MHYGVIQEVTGIAVASGDSGEARQKAGAALMEALNYDFVWSTLTHSQIFGDKRTDMGHAVYQQDGADYRGKVFRLYEDPEDALRFDPWELYGERGIQTLVAEYDAHFDGQNAMYGDTVNMTGIYVTCVSGLIEIFGWDTLLMAAGIDAKGFGEVANRYAKWLLQYFKALAKCKSPVVMVHDDFVWGNGGFFSPEWYREFVFPNYKMLFQPLHEAGKVIMFTCDGNFTQYIDDVAACGVSAFVMEPLTDMAYIAEKYGRTHGFVGNADTNVLLRGTRDDIQAEVKRCMDIGKACPGFFMAVGNHIPANTPMDNVLWYLDCYEKLAKR
jgi:hypothetical protein